MPHTAFPARTRNVKLARKRARPKPKARLKIEYLIQDLNKQRDNILHELFLIDKMGSLIF